MRICKTFHRILCQLSYCEEWVVCNEGQQKMVMQSFCEKPRATRTVTDMARINLWCLLAPKLKLSLLDYRCFWKLWEHPVPVCQLKNTLAAYIKIWWLDRSWGWAIILATIFNVSSLDHWNMRTEVDFTEHLSVHLSLSHAFMCLVSYE